MINLSVSIVVPVYNEEDSVGIFYERLITTIEKNRISADIKEIIFIDNFSTDGTYEKLKELYVKNSTVKIIRHSRNFGYQASILCGLNEAKGDQIIFIDVDCEDPPEMIPQLVAEYRTGLYDLVYGERNDRDENTLIKLIRKLFYRLSKLIADSEFIIDMAEFAMISDRMRSEILKSKSTFPFVRSDFAYVGFPSKGIKYKRSKRVAGKTHYNIIRMIKFGIAGILTISTFPLRMLSYSGIIITAGIAIGLIVDFTNNSNLVNQQIILIALIFYTLICNTVFALYISRIYKDGVQRPVYVIDRKLSKMRDGNENNNHG